MPLNACGRVTGVCKNRCCQPPLCVTTTGTQEKAEEKEEKKKKKSQHMDFQPGPPGLYYPCSPRLDFAVRMGSGTKLGMWPRHEQHHSMSLQINAFRTVAHSLLATFKIRVAVWDCCPFVVGPHYIYILFIHHIYLFVVTCRLVAYSLTHNHTTTQSHNHTITQSYPIHTTCASLKAMTKYRVHPIGV